MLERISGYKPFLELLQINHSKLILWVWKMTSLRCYGRNCFLLFMIQPVIIVYNLHTTVSLFRTLFNWCQTNKNKFIDIIYIDVSILEW